MNDRLLNSIEGNSHPSNIGNIHLAQKLLDRIREQGRITFAEYMKGALYDPEYGYYTSGREKVGTSGDFLTSPTMHPVFGGMIARWLYARWKDMGSPETFEVVEIGAEKGLLGASILAHMREEFEDLYCAITYRVVESKPFRTPYVDLQEKLQVSKSLSEIPANSVVGCFISNEMVDALPVHLVTVENGCLREVYVTQTEGRFSEEIGEVSTPAISAYFERLGISLQEGLRTEVNLCGLDWMAQIGEKLREGFALTIDYGYTAEEYYSPVRMRGTLLCYYRHSYSENPYVHVGEQDITAHVDFTSLMEAGSSAGLDAVDFATQREFLMGLGVEALIPRSSGRRAIMALLDQRGMGGFRVLVQQCRK